MAVTPRDTDEAFLREVDENVRRDQLAKFWASYGRWLIAGVALFLIALGGFLWWQGEQKREAGKAGETLTQAMAKLEVGDKAAVEQLKTLVDTGPGAYPALARMALATNALRAGDIKAATALFDAVAADAKAGEPLRDAALVQSVRLGFDTLPPATVIERLKPLSLPGNPYFAVAGEMTAIAQLKAGQTANARTMLTAIVRDANSPPSLKARAGTLALTLGVSPDTLRPAGAAKLAQ